MHIEKLEIESLEETNMYNLKSIIDVGDNNITVRIIVSGTLYTYNDMVRLGKYIKECL